MQAIGRPVAHHRLHLPEDGLHAEAVLERTREDLHQARQLAVDERLVEDAREEVLEEHERVERAQIDPHLAAGGHRAPELRHPELALALDLHVGLGVGAREDQAPYALGVPERQLLRDHAAHRDAEDVRSRDAERVEQAGRVVRHLVDGVGPGGLRAPPDAAVVEGDRPVARGEVGDLEHPRRRVGGEAHDEEERIAAPVLLVVQLDRVDRGGGHCDVLLCPRAREYGGGARAASNPLRPVATSGLPHESGTPRPGRRVRFPGVA